MWASSCANEATQMKINGQEVPPKLSLAIRLQWTLIVGGPPPAPDVLQVLEECNNERMKILEREVSLCQGFDTPMAYYILSDAYVFMGAKYRREAILYLKKYLDNPAWIPGQEKNRPRYLSLRWHYLGQAYEGEHQFNDAIFAYNQERYLEPDRPAAYVKIADVMRKLNQLTIAIQFLKAAQKTPYYQFPSFGSGFNTVVDSYLSDLEKKQARGYVYKPRKK